VKIEMGTLLLVNPYYAQNPSGGVNECNRLVAPIDPRKGTLLSVKRTRHIGVWLLFVLLQALGVLIPRLTNIHANIWPAFALLLLVPGILLAAVLGLTWGVVFSIPVNAVVWYLGLRLLDCNEGSEASQ